MHIGHFPSRSGIHSASIIMTLWLVVILPSEAPVIFQAKDIRTAVTPLLSASSSWAHKENLKWRFLAKSELVTFLMWSSEFYELFILLLLQKFWYYSWHQVVKLYEISFNNIFHIDLLSHFLLKAFILYRMVLWKFI